MLLGFLPQTVSAQAPSIEYTLSVRNPLSHLYSVEIEINGIRSTNVDIAMPAWSPGVYLIRDFAGNVQQVEAVNRQNRSLPIQQVDKQTWRISKTAADDVRVHYRVYSNALNDEIADITPAATFMYVAGQTQIPLGVRYETEGNWKVYSPLEKRGDRYVAPDYDALAGSPTFLGEFKVVEFKSGNVPFKVVFSNPRIQLTDLQVEADLSDIADAATAMFGGLPFKDYTFLVKVQPVSGSASVGYANSSRILVGENDFVNQTSYTAFLSAAAQGFTRAWYGRGAKPRSMVPYDFSHEAYSRNLWFIEGVANYSADMLLLRSKVLNSTEYFTKATAEVDALQHQAGRLLMTLEESSWNTWTRSENSANAVVSYTLKGKIAGLLLDADIRSRTAGARNLDDVVRRLVSESVTSRTGLDENALENEIQSATGVDVHDFFNSVVRGKGEIDYKRYLDNLGILTTFRKTPPAIFLGIEFDRVEANQARIRRVIPGSPAETGRLDGGDILLAMDSERITFDNLAGRIHSKPLGKAVTLTVMRGERLLTLSITPGLMQTDVWTVSDSPTATPEQLRLRNAWMGVTNGARAPDSQ
jgi:predicted metalloprotease with PDZ domain